MHELPLVKLFRSLKNAGVSLGIRDYELLLEAMAEGFGSNSREDLEHLCCTLWIKSPEDKQTFDIYFQKLIPKAVEPPQSEPLFEIEQIRDNRFEPRSISPRFGRRIRYSVLLMPILLGCAMVSLSIVFHTNFQSVVEEPAAEEPIPEEPTPKDPIPDIYLTTITWLVLLVFLFSFYIGFLFVIFRIEKRIFERRNPQRSHKKITINMFRNQDKLKTLSELLRETHDEFQLLQTLKNSSYNESALATNLSSYLPVTQRQMKQNWRYLRLLLRTGSAMQLDLKATVEQVGKTGLLLKPILIPRRINKAELLFLIDRDGSMLPFHSFGQRLIETAMRGGRLGRVTTYYFNNCPKEYLYKDPARAEERDVESVFNELRQRQTSVIIFSDAGAARGRTNTSRYHSTKDFVSFVHSYTSRVVWLNPLPKERWINTTAERVLQLINMFPIDRNGLDSAVYFLKKGHQYVELVEK